MAYLHARSGIARSGVTYCGWTPPSFTVYIDGTDRTSNILIESASITLNAEAPATFAFTVKNLIPTYGNDVKVAFATPNDYWFAGTLLQMQIEYLDADTVLYHCIATGYEWLIDRYDLVLAEYESRAVNHIAADIIARFTNGNFRIGYCPSSLGSLSMQFTFETVTSALKRLAKACGAQLDIAFDRTVNLYVTYPDAAYAALTSSLIELGTYRSDFDLTQVRTRVVMQGEGATVFDNITVGATTIPVSDTAPFAGGTTAVSGRNQISYTGVTVLAGQGSLTGVTGVSYPIAVNDPINILTVTSDGALDALLAILLGGSLSGQATNYVNDARLTLGEAQARSAADLDVYGQALNTVQFTYRNYVRHLKTGRQLQVVSPASGTFTIQSIQIQPYGQMSGTSTQFFQRVTLGPYLPTLPDLLAS